jgi:hypothetical protein
MDSILHSGNSSGYDFLGCDSLPHGRILTLPSTCCLHPHFRHEQGDVGKLDKTVANQICELERADWTHSKPMNSYVHCFYWLQQHFIWSSLYPTYTTHSLLTFANEGSTFLQNVHIHYRITWCHNQIKVWSLPLSLLRIKCGFTCDSPEPIHVGQQV